MGPRELVMTLIIAGAFAVVGLLIFAQVANTSDGLFDPTVVTAKNESVAITVVTGAKLSDNSTLLANARNLVNTETVANGSNAADTLTRGTDYVIVLTGGSGSGGTRANFTLLDVGYNVSNITADLKVTYQYNTDSTAKTSVNVVETTFLDAYSLGMIALLVLAAVVVLGVVFKLGT